MKASIEATKDALEKAQDNKESRLLDNPVRWTGTGSVMEADTEIKSYSEGLEWLKAEREARFPSWKEILIED